MSSETRTIILILGPTGVGKSRNALRLASKFDGEIISCDSMQVYRGFDIGTDKPSAEARRTVSHHLLDVADPSEQFTAADFVEGAMKAVADIVGRGRRPFIVGGTGLYFKVLLDGLFPGPGRSEEIRNRLETRAEEKGLEALFRDLESVDPVYAGKIGPRDRVRIVRALEVHELTGKPMTEMFRRTESRLKDFLPVKIGLKLERRELVRRIEDRVDRMFDEGLVEEVQSLRARGIPEEAPPFHALGYEWVVRHLKGEIGLDEARERTKIDTRRYAKRQMTWFRKMEGIAWFDPDDESGLEEYTANNIK